MAFTSKMFEKHLWKSDILSKDAGHQPTFLLKNVTVPQVFFKHFASKSQLPGFYISRTLVKNGLNQLDNRKINAEKETVIAAEILTKKRIHPLIHLTLTYQI